MSTKYCGKTNSTMIVIVGTAPQTDGSNSGDLLISQAATDLIQATRPDIEVEYLFRVAEFRAHLDLLENAEAVVFPGFPIRDPLIPDTLNFGDLDLDRLDASLVPLGAGWSSKPGDYTDLRSHRYSDKTARALRKVAQNGPGFTARDRYTKRILEAHGAGESIPVVGDCAWYHLDSLEKSYHRPSDVSSLIFSTPHSVQYEEQGRSIIDLLSSRYPKADRTCLLHQAPTPHEARLADYATERGFERVNADGDAAGLRAYRDVDLHVGYRLHGHISAIRYRRPSVLLAEDGRGRGFGATIPTGVFPASERFVSSSSPLSYHLARSAPVRGIRKILRIAGLSNQPAFAGAIPHLDDEVRDWLDYAEQHDWRVYEQVGNMIDRNYAEVMSPYLDNCL
jgi:hypothetical protein